MKHIPTKLKNQNLWVHSFGYCMSNQTGCKGLHHSDDYLVVRVSYTWTGSIIWIILYTNYQRRHVIIYHYVVITRVGKTILMAKAQADLHHLSQTDKIKLLNTQTPLPSLLHPHSTYWGCLCKVTVTVHAISYTLWYTATWTEHYT